MNTIHFNWVHRYADRALCEFTADNVNNIDAQVLRCKAEVNTAGDIKYPHVWHWHQVNSTVFVLLVNNQYFE